MDASAHHVISPTMDPSHRDTPPAIMSRVDHLDGWKRSRFGVAAAAMALLVGCGQTAPHSAMPQRLGMATAPVQPYRLLNIEEWRSAQAFADTYIPHVRIGNTTRLREAALPFARYFGAIHNRLHGIFEEELQAAREAYPELRAAADLRVDVEIVLDQENGRIARLGVVRSSGSIVFDAVALAALRRAAPFGVPPPSIVSPGGNVYVHWVFHTNPTILCAPWNTRPYLLATPP